MEASRPFEFSGNSESGISSETLIAGNIGCAISLTSCFMRTLGSVADQVAWEYSAAN